MRKSTNSSTNAMPSGTARFIATLGTEPQVITAALDLLQQQGETISRVIVLHTVSAGTIIDAAVVTLRKAFDDYSQHGISLTLIPICDTNGMPQPDVDTLTSTQAAFRTLYNQVRLAKRTGYRVHLSIAGGRKTMAVFGMVTAQLLFEDEDRLWHLYSSGEFLDSKRLHPQPGDDVHLIPIPVVLWSRISPVLLDLGNIEDPFEALKRQQALRLAERLEDGRAFVRGALTPGEERVVALLVREGLRDENIADRLSLSPRTVEEHLRAAYKKAANHWELESVNRASLISLLSLFYTLSTI